MTDTPTAGFHQLPLNHLGYRVDDLEAAIEGWTRAYGAGPFYVLSDMTFDELEFMGEPVHWEHVAAYGACGQLGIELQTFGFREPMPELDERLGGSGYRLNHVGYYVEDTPAASARLEALGYPMFLYGRSGEDRFYWHDGPYLGHAIELHSEIDAITDFTSAARLAASGWDGTDPIRTTLPEGLSEVSLAYLLGRR